VNRKRKRLSLGFYKSNHAEHGGSRIEKATVLKKETFNEGDLRTSITRGKFVVYHSFDT